MKAIVQERYGDTDVLQVRDIDLPVCGDDEVRVRVHAAGVDPSVWHLMAGVPYLIRLGFGLRAPRHRVRGSDVAGTVEAVGEKVSRFRPGDDVFGFADGSFAEYACAKERKLARKPANLTFDQAAVVAMSGLTALQGLRDKGRVKPGQHVLVIGAAGGVGSYAVQLAKAYGAEVTGVCSTAKVELVRKLGADHVVDYTRENLSERSDRYDVILDTVGNRSLSLLRRLLAPRGALVIVGARSTTVGSAGRSACSARCCCRRSSAIGCPRSSRPRGSKTLRYSGTSSSPVRSRRSSTARMP
jgi:NADPH:quinone reductase-like Zn-dependent oxidoreductase